MNEHTKLIPVVEMFGPTIQGEGLVIGQQTYFIRLGLCDFRCKMCDSMNAVDPAQVKANAKWMSELEIFEKFTSETWRANSTKWITLTGGNPCIHSLTNLLTNFRTNGFKIALETQGSEVPKWLHLCNSISISPKGPGMGETQDFEVLDYFVDVIDSTRGLKDVYFKIVVFDQRDLEFAKMVYERYYGSKIPFYLSLGNPYPPGFNENYDSNHDHFGKHIPVLIGQYKMLFEDIQNDAILSQMIFLPQWHVFVWGNEKGR